VGLVTTATLTLDDNVSQFNKRINDYTRPMTLVMRAKGRVPLPEFTARVHGPRTRVVETDLNVDAVEIVKRVLTTAQWCTSGQ